jgi:hypothetical protein
MTKIILPRHWNSRSKARNLLFYNLARNVTAKLVAPKPMESSATMARATLRRRLAHVPSGIMLTSLVVARLLVTHRCTVEQGWRWTCNLNGGMDGDWQPGRSVA